MTMLNQFEPCPSQNPGYNTETRKLESIPEHVKMTLLLKLPAYTCFNKNTTVTLLLYTCFLKYCDDFETPCLHMFQ